MSRSWALLCSLLCLSVPALAQVTITTEDVTARLAVGQKVTENTDTLVTSVNIGAPGATSWDFSTLAAHTFNEATSLAQPQPFDSAFPGSPYVMKSSLAGVVPIPSLSTVATVTGDLYLYYSVGTAFVTPGTYGTGTASANLGGIPVSSPGTVKIFNTPKDTTYPLPVTYGMAWREAYTSTQIITLQIGIPINPTIIAYDLRDTVDAYGPMKMPGGGTYDALRIKMVNKGDAKTVSYLFLAKNGASVRLQAADTLQPTSGIIAVRRKGTVWTNARPLAVAGSPETPAEFALQQNYPNPFNPATTIRFSVPSRSFVSLRVYNALGQEVANLANGVAEPGLHAVSFRAQNLPSGPYFYRLSASPLEGGSGAFVQTKVMMLVK